MLAQQLSNLDGLGRSRPFLRQQGGRARVAMLAHFLTMFDTGSTA